MADSFAPRIGDAVTATIKGGNAKDIPVEGTVHAVAGDPPAQVQIATGHGIYVWLPVEDVKAADARPDQG
jgi:hypothetical protein